METKDNTMITIPEKDWEKLCNENAILREVCKQKQALIEYLERR